MTQNTAARDLCPISLAKRSGTSSSSAAAVGRFASASPRARGHFLRTQIMKVFKDAGHLFRLAAVFLAGFIVFLVVRSFLVPRSFGRYGHYRADAIAETAALPISYAGHQVCEGCHSDVVDVKNKGVTKAWLASPAMGRRRSTPTTRLPRCRPSWTPLSSAFVVTRPTSPSRKVFRK